MKTRELRFRISKVQREQQLALLNALAVSILVIIGASVGPQYLYQYFLQEATLEKQMLILGNLPGILYGFGFAVLVVTFIRNFFRGRMIRTYEQEIQLLSYMMTDDCNCCDDSSCDCDCHGGNWDADLIEEDTEVEVVEEAAPAKKSAKKSKKSTAKKASKKTSTKKSK